MLNREEFCNHCGDPTGRGGNFHESLKASLPNEEKIISPLCDGCAEELKNQGAEITGE